MSRCTLRLTAVFLLLAVAFAPTGLRAASPEAPGSTPGLSRVPAVDALIEQLKPRDSRLAALTEHAESPLLEDSKPVPPDRLYGSYTPAPSVHRVPRLPRYPEPVTQSEAPASVQPVPPEPVVQQAVSATPEPQPVCDDDLDRLLNEGARCLDGEGSWSNRERGLRIYDQLKWVDGQRVTAALMRAMRHRENRLRILFLAVRLGIAGSEETLGTLLDEHGDKELAEDFLNCGSDKLDTAAREWTARHNGYVATGNGSHRVGWGTRG